MDHSHSYINIRHRSQPVLHQHPTWITASRTSTSDIGHSQSYINIGHGSQPVDINIRHGSQPVVHQHRTWVTASSTLRSDIILASRTSTSDMGHRTWVTASQPIVHQHPTWVIASRTSASDMGYSQSEKNSQGKQQAVGLQSKQQLPSSVCGVGLSAVFCLSALRRLRVGSASLNHWTVHS